MKKKTLFLVIDIILVVLCFMISIFIIKINQYDQSLQQTIDFYEEHMITYIELLGQIAQAISP